MDRVVMIDGKERHLKASALLPRQYRYHFGRDLMVDMKKALERNGKSIDDAVDNYGLEDMDMSTFENLAWLMLRNGGEDVGGSPEEWLDSIDDSMMIYSIMGDVVALWTASNATMSKPKKK